MPIYWDAHCCPPLTVNSNLSFLSRYKSVGIDFVSVNVGFDLCSQLQIINLLSYFHNWIKKNDDAFRLIKNVEEIRENKENNLLSIAFDIEGCNPLNNNIEMVDYFYDFGVRQMCFSYNANNSTGGGCYDQNAKLTSYGRKLVKKFNETGMIIDCSHVSSRASMEIIELSEFPVIFSHSNPFSLVNHPRNIKDEQIISCASKGGVIGINGVGIFLGNNETDSFKIVEHIEYVANLVGTQHVGIGLDCLFNSNEMSGIIKENPKYFLKNDNLENVKIAEPEQFLEIKDLLEIRGFKSKEINMILGGNFGRVASQVWK